MTEKRQSLGKKGEDLAAAYLKKKGGYKILFRNYRCIFGEMDIPMVLDADIGHLPPQLLLINGAHATVRVGDRKIEVTTELRP